MVGSRLDGKRRIVAALHEEYERATRRHDEDLGHLVGPGGDCELRDDDQFLVEPCRCEGDFEAEDPRSVDLRSRDDRRPTE